MIWLLACAPAPDSVAPEILTESALVEATTSLTALGPRLVATPAEADAADTIEAVLLDAGLVPERAPFSWDAWQPGTAQITVGGAVVEGAPLSPSPSVSNLSGILATADFSGKIALFSSDDGSRSGQFTAALTGGAIGMVRITEATTEEGALLVEVGHTLENSALPAIAVDTEAGAVLLAAAGEAARLDIQTSEVADHVSDNILATVPGTGSGWVAVTAHYDSWHPSESAADNALGVAMLLLLAEQMAGAQPERSVLFLATSGEEQGLQGALRWTLDNEAWVDDIDQVINIDVPWASEGDLICGASDPDWAEAAADAMDAEGLSATPRDGPAPASDHFPFQVRGVDALWCTRFPYREYHTVADTLDQLNMTEATAVLRAHWAILAEAAGVP